MTDARDNGYGLVHCRSCGAQWDNAGECACTCVEGQELPYEDWVLNDPHYPEHASLRDQLENNRSLLDSARAELAALLVERERLRDALEEIRERGLADENESVRLWTREWAEHFRAALAAESEKS